MAVLAFESGCKIRKTLSVGPGRDVELIQRPRSEFFHHARHSHQDRLHSVKPGLEFKRVLHRRLSVGGLNTSTVGRPVDSGNAGVDGVAPFVCERPS